MSMKFLLLAFCCLIVFIILIIKFVVRGRLEHPSFNLISVDASNPNKATYSCFLRH